MLGRECHCSEAIITVKYNILNKYVEECVTLAAISTGPC
jgi:hypothetical protein